ncbi:unnamed protein product [Rotaria sp. Silwood1]|nr:unnamed protein product [Rotaria sp. Silwood1]CAF5097002.1 unnamed protein product [Rotaria sp. Silwood1]
MNKFWILIFISLYSINTNAQAKKQPVKKRPKTVAAKPVVYDGVIRTTNSDTLYFEIDNAVILTPKNNQKAEYYFKATSGEINKLSNNFYQLGNIKDSSVTITVFDKATDALIETKKYVVAKQILPF